MKQILQPNFIPINLALPTDSALPLTNTPPVALGELNLAPSANGSILIRGSAQSPNFSKGKAGWQLGSDGSIDANEGTFTGTISDSAGTILLAVNVITNLNEIIINNDEVVHK